jgi:uncharacterized cupredoxin-like copper-binding protein
MALAAPGAGKAAGVVILVAAAAALLATCSPIPIRSIEVTIRHSRYLPANLDVAPGTTVRFVLKNTDPIDHEFILGNEEVQARHETGTEPRHGAVPGEVSVPAGGEATTIYTFSQPGRLLVGCHLPGHYAYGMRGSVRVG